MLPSLLLSRLFTLLRGLLLLVLVLDTDDLTS
ncbi:MAG: hypothetical protein QOC61_995 [Acidobacteriota bacterium]|jgi:hypothetical protein|nr:hypothetical protein [Acidobacteriota bacterium]MDT5261991.1 hypothetical protein [Acidobacteriota bacterium]MDT7778831.1 hypothetical protein [Acidobacteriota bacterium]